MSETQSRTDFARDLRLVNALGEAIGKPLFDEISMPNCPAPDLGQLVALIEGHTFHFQCESELQNGLKHLFTENQVPWIREFRMSPNDRLDFLVFTSDVGRVGVEVKTGGGLSDLVRQLHRYAQGQDESQGAPFLKSILVVTSRMGLCRLPEILAGVPVHVALVGGGI